MRSLSPTFDLKKVNLAIEDYNQTSAADPDITGLIADARSPHKVLRGGFDFQTSEYDAVKKNIEVK